jgi:hypothetical protein
MLNNQDKKWIKEAISEGILDAEKRIVPYLTAYVDIKVYPLEQKLSHMDNIPTKEEFYDIADKLLTSNKKVEQELAALSQARTDHENRIHKLEVKVDVI